MHNIGSSLDHTLKSRAQQLHANSAQLARQEKDVVKATEGLRREGDKLKRVADEGQRKVKELGNVQNWAEMLERDFLLLEETLRLVRNGNRPREGGSGDYEGSDWETSRSGSEDGERDDESIEGDLRRGKGLPVGGGGGWGRADSRAYGPSEEINGIDGEGDTAMGDTAINEAEVTDKGKVKEVVDGNIQHHIKPQVEQPVELEQTHEQIQEQFIETNALEHQEHQAEVIGGSSTATATATDTSNSEPSSSSIHTSTSITS